MWPRVWRVRRLCKGYAHHHFDSIANSLHAAGMTAGLVSVGVGLAAKHLSAIERIASVLWHPPQWYLYAWVGHFAMQKDIPAVFTCAIALSPVSRQPLCTPPGGAATGHPVRLRL